MKIPDEILYKLPITANAGIKDEATQKFLKDLSIAITDFYRDIAVAIKNHEDRITALEP